MQLFICYVKDKANASSKNNTRQNIPFQIPRPFLIGFYNRIIDNALEPTDRNLFYMFQDYDLLTTESEETTLWDGREWRIHYWKFKPDLKERMESYMQRQRQPEDIDPFADIYGTDGRTIWTRESEKVANPNAFTSDW